MRLDPHALLGSHEDARTVHMRAEGHAVLGDLPKLCERKDLKPPAIGEDRTVPIKKLMESAHSVDEIVTRTDMQMVGIRKLNLTSDLTQIVGRDSAFDGGARSDVHENGGLDGAVHGMESAAARLSLGTKNFKHIGSFTYLILSKRRSSSDLESEMAIGLPCGQTVISGSSMTLSQIQWRCASS